ncbi:hypothetical protein BOX15_Mlig020081g1, partial [Macrostomum lignano]
SCEAAQSAMRNEPTAAAAVPNSASLAAAVGIRRRWAIEFSLLHHRSPASQSRHYDSLSTATAQLAAPAGYMDRPPPLAGGREPDGALISKRGWDAALGPLKQLPMNLFIMWMAGNSVSIFPIMMVLMLFMRPIQAVFAMQATFAQIEGGQACLQRFVYLIGNLAVLALAVYKCHTMGLLPTYESDWLSFVDSPRRTEVSGGGFLL